MHVLGSGQTARGSGWIYWIVSGRLPRLCGDSRIHKDSSSPANLQVRKGGLPPLERQRRDLFTLAFKLQHQPAKPESASLRTFFLTNPVEIYQRVSGGKPPFLTCKLPDVPLGFHTVSTAHCTDYCRGEGLK